MQLTHGEAPAVSARGLRPAGHCGTFPRQPAGSGEELPMDMKYVDDSMPRRIDEWHSPTLGQRMPIVSYGNFGHPVLLFPTAAADFLENERFFLVKAVEPAILAGRVRVFSINSINSQAWMDKNVPVPEQARRQALYAQYVEQEVVPYIRAACQS